MKKATFFLAIIMCLFTLEYAKHSNDSIESKMIAYGICVIIFVISVIKVEKINFKTPNLDRTQSFFFGAFIATMIFGIGQVVYKMFFF